MFDNFDTPSTTQWNQMIKGYLRSHIHEESLKLFKQMVREAWPNAYTYVLILSGCSRSEMLKEGKQIHVRVLTAGYCTTNVFVGTSLVNMYASANDIPSAREVFDDMPLKSVVSWNSLLFGYMKSGDVDEACKIFDSMHDRNTVSWTTMISGCTKNGWSREAVHLFRKMWRDGEYVDNVAMLSVLTGCADLGNLQLGRLIHSFFEKTCVEKCQTSAILMYNALMHLYASCGVIEDAYKVFIAMPRKRNDSWTTIITGFAKQGYAQEAIALLRWMQNVEAKDVKPDGITFLSVLSACSHAGLVQEGRQYFDNMVSVWGITPTSDHYACMIDLLCRAGFLSEAEKLLNNMPMKPNDAIFGALLSGCLTHKNEVIGSRVAEKLVRELPREKAPGYLVLLAHFYMTAERWCDVACMRKLILDMGISKPAGQSWLQLHGTMHHFVANDKSHKHSNLICKMLDVLTLQARSNALISRTYEDLCL